MFKVSQIFLIYKKLYDKILNKSCQQSNINEQSSYNSKITGIYIFLPKKIQNWVAQNDSNLSQNDLIFIFLKIEPKIEELNDDTSIKMKNGSWYIIKSQNQSIFNLSQYRHFW